MIFALLCAVFSRVSSTYTLTTPPEFALATPRVDAAAIGVNDARGLPLVVVAGGNSPDVPAIDELVVFDILAKSQQTYRMQSARDDADVGTVADLVLIGGGDDGGFPNSDNLRTTIEIFNVTSRAFLTPYTISLPRRNIEVACTSFVCAFIGGIAPGSVRSKLIDAFDVRTKLWTSFPMLDQREDVAAVAVGDSIYLTGGGLSASERRFTVEVIDFSSTDQSKWKSVYDAQSLPFSFYDHSGVRGGAYPIFAGGILRNTTGGQDGNVDKDQCIVRVNGNWQVKPFGGSLYSFYDPVHETRGIALGEYGLFVGGRDDFLTGNGTRYMFLFNPNDISNSYGGWSFDKMTLPEPVHSHAAAGVVYGRTGYVLVIGGGKLSSISSVVSVVHLITFTDDPLVYSTCNACGGDCVAPNRCIVPISPTPPTPPTSPTSSQKTSTIIVITGGPGPNNSGTSLFIVGSGSGNSNQTLAIALGVVGGVLLCLVVGIALYCVLRRRRDNVSSIGASVHYDEPSTYVSQGYVSGSVDSAEQTYAGASSLRSNKPTF